MKRSLLSSIFATSVFLTACGSGVEQTTLSAKDSIAEKSSISEKAVYTTAPVYRFAKSNGAYFYTGSAVEAEQIRLNYPDFRYEGVAFNQVTSGNGQFVYRFANLVTGGYFYTASVAEKDYVLNDPVFKTRFRLDQAGFFVAPDNDPLAYPVYRAANRANGAYLYTLSQPEVNYAVNVIKTWNDEGLKFRVPNVPTVNASWPIASFSSYTVGVGFGTTDAIPATVNETDTFAVGANRYQITKTASGCTTGSTSITCKQLLNGNVLNICERIGSAANGYASGKHVLLSAAVQQASYTELAGKWFSLVSDCDLVGPIADVIFDAQGNVFFYDGTFDIAAEIAAAFGPNGFSAPGDTETIALRAYKVEVGGQLRYFFVYSFKDNGTAANSGIEIYLQN